MNRFLDQKIVSLLEKKCHQKNINYTKRNRGIIFFKYYVKQIYNTFINREEREEGNSLVVSYVEDLNNINYLNQVNYLNIKNIKGSFLRLFIEVYRFPIYFFQILFFKSDYKNQIFEAYLQSNIVVNYILKNKIKQVIFYGYDYDLSFVVSAYRLQQKGVETIQYCNSGFLSIHNLVISDSIFFRTNIQVEYAQKNRDIFMSNNIFSLMPKYQKKEIKRDSYRRIGIYTSGFYARTSFSKSNYLENGIEAEKRMLSTIKEYAQRYRTIEIVLFIHLHNNIENIKDAKEYYKDILLEKNIRLQREEEKSIDTFENFGLAITCLSEIFFDRIERGYKAILIEPFCCEDYIALTPLKNISIVSDNMNAIEEIESFRRVSTKSFFELL